MSLKGEKWRWMMSLEKEILEHLKKLGGKKSFTEDEATSLLKAFSDLQEQRGTKSEVMELEVKDLAKKGIEEKKSLLAQVNVPDPNQCYLMHKIVGLEELTIAIQKLTERLEREK
jgi:hypothetical protein